MTPSYCRKCGTAIHFLPNGKTLVPVDANTVKPSHTRFDAAVLRNHFATCRAVLAAKQAKLRALKSKLNGDQP